MMAKMAGVYKLFGQKMKISFEEIGFDGTIFLKLLKIWENVDSLNFGQGS